MLIAKYCTIQYNIFINMPIIQTSIYIYMRQINVLLMLIDKLYWHFHVVCARMLHMNRTIKKSILNELLCTLLLYYYCVESCKTFSRREIRLLFRRRYKKIELYRFIRLIHAFNILLYYKYNCRSGLTIDGNFFFHITIYYYYGVVRLIEIIL